MWLKRHHERGHLRLHLRATLKKIVSFIRNPFMSSRRTHYFCVPNAIEAVGPRVYGARSNRQRPWSRSVSRSSTGAWTSQMYLPNMHLASINNKELMMQFQKKHAAPSFRIVSDASPLMLRCYSGTKATLQYENEQWNHGPAAQRNAVRACWSQTNRGMYLRDSRAMKGWEFDHSTDVSKSAFRDLGVGEEKSPRMRSGWICVVWTGEWYPLF